MGVEPIRLMVNGKPVVVQPGTTVAAAVLISESAMRIAGTRTSTAGEARAPLCGMGICFECRTSINGSAHRKSCQILCRPGMDVRTS